MCKQLQKAAIICGERPVGEYIFQEAKDHSRCNKYHRDEFLKKNEKLINKYNNNTTFNNIFQDVLIISEQINADIKKKNFNNTIGKLQSYDIAAALCRYHNINIEYIYLAGGGPLEAIKKLKINKKKDIITGLEYVNIEDIKQAFKNSKYKDKLPTTLSGDTWETFLCQWQKQFK
jgi:hypothetical protein